MEKPEKREQKDDVEAEIEDERSIKLLLEKHLVEVAELRKACKDVLEADHDDVFLLRYVLSYKVLAKSESHVRDGIKFRKENPWLNYAKTGEVWEVNTKVERFTCASQSHNRKIDGGPIQYIRACIADPGVLAKNVTEDELCKHLTFIKEEAFLICDKLTRESGRLTKLVVVFDMKNVSMGIPAKSIQNGMNKSSEIAQHLYPQLLERVAIINAPWFMKQLWKVARMILSERLTSKAAMCMGQFEPGQEPNRMHECPWASKQLRPEETPSFVGGMCMCKDKGGCVGGIPNDNYEPKKGPSKEEQEAAAAAYAAAHPEEKKDKKGWFW